MSFAYDIRLFIIRDYDEIIDGILHLSPLSSSQENRILLRIKDVSKSAILEQS